MKIVDKTKEQLSAENQRLKDRVAELEGFLAKSDPEDQPLIDVYKNVRTAISNLQEGFFKTNLNGKLLLYNDEFAKIFGLQPNKNYHNLNFIKYWQNSDESKQYFDRILKDGFINNFIINSRNTQGDQIIVRINSWLNSEEDGTTKSITSSCIDITETRNWQENIQRSDIILNTTSDAIVATDVDGFITRWNRGAETLLKYNADEILGKHVGIIYKKEDQLYLKKLMIEALTKENIPDIEVTCIDKYKQDVNLLVSISNIKDANGNIKELVGISKPIGKYKIAEKAIRLSQKYYQALFENAPGPTWLEDYSDVYAFFDILKKKGIRNVRKFFNEHPDQLENCLKRIVITDVNNAAMKLFKAKSKDDFLGNLNKIFTSESFIVFKESVVQLASGKRNFESEAEVKTLKGKKKYIFYKLTIEKEEPDYYKAIISAVDITDKKQKETELRESEEFNRVIMENVPIGIAVNSVDPKVNFSYMNDNFPKMYRTNREALSKSGNFWDTVYEDPEYREYIKQKVVDDCATGDISQMRWEDIPITRKGKGKYFINAQNIPLPNRDLMISTVWDVTDRKKSELALRKSETKYRELFEKNLAGIFRTTLRGEILECNEEYAHILGYSSIDEMKKVSTRTIYPDPEDRKKLIDTLKKKREVKNIVIKLKKKDGSLIWVQDHISLIYDEERKEELLFGTMIDITEQKNAEERLKISNEKYRLLAENTYDVIWTLDLNFRFSYVSPNVENLLSYPREEVLGQPLAKFVVHNEFQRIVDMSVNALQNYEAFEPGIYETLMLQKNGEEFPVEVTVRLLLNENGFPIGFQGSARDITARKEMENKLVQKEEKYRGIFENIQDVYYEISTDGKILEISPSIYILSKGQYTREELIGKQITSIYAEPDARTYLLEKLKQTGGVHDYEIKFINKDGSFRIVSITAKLSLKADGQIDKIIGSMRDITDRKLAEKTLKESEKRYRDIFEYAPLGIYQSTLNGHFITVNKRLVEILGYDSEEELIEKDMSTDIYYDKNERKALVKKYEPLGSIVNLELKWKKKNGDPVWISLSSYTIKNILGKTISFEGFVEDITKRKEAEDLLKESEKFLKETQKIAQLGSYTLDIKNGIWKSTPVLDTIFGIESDFDKSVNGWISLIHPEWRQLINDYFSMEVLGLKKKFDKEYKIIRKNDQQERWVHGMGELVFNDKSEPIKLVGSIIDITERKRAEEALKQSEERYRLISEVSSDYVFSTKVEKDGTLILDWASGAFERMTGYSLSEYDSKDGWRNSLHPDSLKRDDKDLEQLLTNKSVVSELLTKRKDGSLLWVESSALPVWDENENRLVGIYGSVRDITDRKYAEEALIKSEERFRGIYENSIIGLYRTTPDGRILMANPALVKMLDYPSFEILAQRNLNKDGFEPYYPRKIFQKKIEEDGQIIGFESIWAKYDGSKLFVSESTRAIYDENGNIIYYDGIVQDITERKLAEEALIESENKYKSLFEESADATLLIDNDKFVDCNPAALSMFGYKNKKEIANQHPSHISPALQEDGKNSFNKANEMMTIAYKNGSHRFEWLHKRRSGEVFPAEVLLTTIPVGKKHFIHAVIRDITDRKQAEVALSESEIRYRHLVELSPDAIMIHRDGKFVFVNNAAIKIFNAKRKEDFIGKPIVDRVHPDYRNVVKNRLRNLAKDSFSRVPVIEEKFIKYDGTVFDVEVTANHFLFEGKDAVQVIARDITERKKHEDALHESESNYRNLIERSNDAIYLLFNRKFEIINSKFVRMFGFTKAEVNRPDFDFMEMVAPKSRKNVIDRQKHFNDRKKLVNKYEFTALTKDGNEIEVETSVAYINYKDGIATQGIIRDITKRKKQQEKLMKTIIQVQEEEKSNFGKELHDGLGQTLTSISLYLESFRKISEHLPENKKRDLDHARRLNKQAISDARKISHGLMLRNIENQKITDLLRQLCHDSTTPTTKFLCYFRNTKDLMITRDLRLHLYRITQELTTNILRHSGATEARIWLSVLKDESLKLIVSDNGRGIKKKDRRNTPGAGLVNIEQRVTICRGKWKMISKTGIGTKFIMTVPL